MELFFTVWFGIHVVWIFLLLYPLFALYLSRPAWYNQAHRLRRFWGRLLFALGPIFPKKRGLQHIDKKETYVVVANHSSYMDIPSLSVCLPIQLNFIAKAELGKVPLFGIFFRTIDISVDRKQARDGALAYRRAVDQLKNKERSLVVFPEGGIPKSAPKLSPFKDGAFKMAIESGCPILPVVLPDNHDRLPADRFAAWPGRMRVVVLEPIVTQGLTDADIPRIKAEMHQRMESALQQRR